MENRRDFLKKAGALAAAGAVPAAIERALAIEPVKGSTFYDAEHVVILMQENRSFDHCYGALRGVRGFNDPRSVTLPNGNPVWLQSNAAGETRVPFRLDLKGSNATWLGCLPHDWADQSRARNGGKHDGWLDAKKSPMTLGFYTREDLPFYYALADAFTICDQNFCSSLTGTNPNRLHLWSGTIRAVPHPESPACVRNDDAEHSPGLPWKSFPERLQEAGIPWRVYQNELYVHTGLDHEQSPWLGNFGDNALEYFAAYGVRFARRHREFLRTMLRNDEAGLKKLGARPRPWTPAEDSEYKGALNWVLHYRRELEKWSEKNWRALPEVRKDLHRRAFTVNEGDPHFRELMEVTYQDGAVERRMKVPRGDVLHQFRADAAAGKLPAVSWLAAPQVFSDHPDSPWYGAWYISEALDILTSKPDLWRKTVFILCYDENDGYFDHVPPFTPPDPQQPGSGKASAGLDTELEFVRQAQEDRLHAANPRIDTHTGPIGLGYRTPLVIASPWSRGGYVCSQVFDHTSILQFLEKWLTKKTGRPISEPNISLWRRAICGDLTAAFRPALEKTASRLEKMELPKWLHTIHGAQYKPEVTMPAPLTAEDIAGARRRLRDLKQMPLQESGTKPACALPYELTVTGALAADRKSFAITFAAGREKFGDRAAGAPFHVYTPGEHRSASGAAMEKGRVWSYAVIAGTKVEETWLLERFAGGTYHLRVHGPNGFFREYRGDAGDPPLTVGFQPRTEGGAELVLSLRDGAPPLEVVVENQAYRQAGFGGGATQSALIEPGKPWRQPLELKESFGWYDVSITVKSGKSYLQRLAGHVETGNESFTDPLMAAG
jgi:phospholipase C